MNPISLFLGLSRTVKLVSILGTLFMLALPFIVSKCHKQKETRQIAEKQTEIQRDREKATKSKVEAYSIIQKQEQEVLDTLPETKQEKVPTKEELKEIREKVIKKFKGGLP